MGAGERRSIWAGIHAWVTSVPPTIARENRRPYLVALAGGTLGVLAHLFFLVFFAIYDVAPLFYFNIGSVALFVAVLFLVRRTGATALGFILTSAEVLCHQVLAVYLLGWDYGFQFFLLAIPAFVCVGHFPRRVVPILFVALSAVTLGWLYLHGQHLYHPHLRVPAGARTVLYTFNLGCIALLIAAVSVFYARMARRIEGELAEQYEQLRQTQLALVQSEKMAAVGKLVAGLSHEINSPIGAILSNAQTGARAVDKIRARRAEAPPAGKEARTLEALGKTLGNTADAAQRLGELVGRLQGLVRLDEAEVKRADLHEGIDSAIALLQNQTQEGPIELVRRFDRTLPQVLCRPAEINQVLMHLLQNAIDAIEGAGTITISTRREGDRVRISVRDTGRGMRPEELEGIFDPGFSSGRERVKLGMGLPISQQIVARHGGELHVESRPGAGSTFTLVLPEQMSC